MVVLDSLYLAHYFRVSHDITATKLVFQTKKRRSCWCPDPILEEFEHYYYANVFFFFVCFR